MLAIALVATSAGGTLAQETSITAPAPERTPTGRALIAPSMSYEITRPDDANFYPPGPRVHHDPAFIGPLSGQTGDPPAQGRAGVAGWTSPNTAVGAPAGWQEVTGWFAVGGAWTWGRPPTGARAVR